MYRRCAICDKDLSYDLYNNYFCKECYTTYKDDILSKKEWVKYLANLEHNRRRRKQRDFIYFGEGYDVTEDGELIFGGGNEQQN